MRRGNDRIAYVSALSACFVVAACSLVTDLDGFAEPFSREAGNDAFAGAETSIPDGADGAAEAAFDPAPPCVAQTVIDTPLTATLGTWSPRSSQAGGYPKVESFFGSPAAVLIPFVDTTPVPIDAVCTVISIVPVFAARSRVSLPAV